MTIKRLNRFPASIGGRQDRRVIRALKEKGSLNMLVSQMSLSEIIDLSRSAEYYSIYGNIYYIEEVNTLMHGMAEIKFRATKVNEENSAPSSFLKDALNDISIIQHGLQITDIKSEVILRLSPSGFVIDAMNK